MPEDVTTDYYRLLGVEPDASRAVIKKAYMRAVRKYHPDVAGDAGAEMTVKINAAWDVLSHDGKRAEYDASRAPKPPEQTVPERPAYTPTSEGSPWDETPESGQGTGGAQAQPAPEPAQPVEKIIPRQATLPIAVAAMAISMLCGVGVAFGAFRGATESGFVVATAAFSVFAVLTFLRGMGVRVQYANRWKIGAAAVYVGIPLFTTYSDEGLGSDTPTSTWVRLGAWALASLVALGIAWLTRWVIADYFSIVRPGVTFFPVDAARAFEQGEPSPQVPQWTMAELRRFSTIPGVRIIHELWPYESPVGIPAAIICANRVAMVFTLPAAVPPASRKAVLKDIRRAAGAFNSHCSVLDRTSVWVLTDIPAEGWPKKARGLRFVAPEDFPRELSGWLGTGPVRRDTLWRVWRMKA